MTGEQGRPQGSRRQGIDDGEDLDDLLARSAPVTTAMTTLVHEQVHQLVKASAGERPTAAVARGGRWARGRRVATGAGVAALALTGVTAAAAASPGAPEWLSWVQWPADTSITDGPGHCALHEMRVMPEGTAVDDPAVVAARAYLVELDLDDVDYADELAEQKAMTVTGVGVEPGGQTGEDFFSGEELEYNAYTNAISAMVWAEVERQGLDSEVVSIEGRGTGCAEQYR